MGYINVHFVNKDNIYELIIEDNGCGFDMVEMKKKLY